MFHVSRTLKNGATDQERAIVYQGTGPNGAPTITPNFTVPMVPRGNWQAIDLIAFTPADEFHVKVWWYYASANQWVYDTDIGSFSIKAADGVIKLPIISLDKSECADGIYIETESFVGAGSRANVWLQGQQ
jgi:hypothetical protein